MPFHYDNTLKRKVKAAPLVADEPPAWPIMRRSADHANAAEHVPMKILFPLNQ